MVEERRRRRGSATRWPSSRRARSAARAHAGRPQVRMISLGSSGIMSPRGGHAALGLSLHGIERVPVTTGCAPPNTRRAIRPESSSVFATSMLPIRAAPVPPVRGTEGCRQRPCARARTGGAGRRRRRPRRGPPPVELTVPPVPAPAPWVAPPADPTPAVPPVVAAAVPPAPPTSTTVPPVVVAAAEAPATIADYVTAAVPATSMIPPVVAAAPPPPAPVPTVPEPAALPSPEQSPPAGV